MIRSWALECSFISWTGRSFFTRQSTVQTSNNRSSRCLGHLLSQGPQILGIALRTIRRPIFNHVREEPHPQRGVAVLLDNIECRVDRGHRDPSLSNFADNVLDLLAERVLEHGQRRLAIKSVSITSSSFPLKSRPHLARLDRIIRTVEKGLYELRRRGPRNPEERIKSVVQQISTSALDPLGTAVEDRRHGDKTGFGVWEAGLSQKTLGQIQRKSFLCWKHTSGGSIWRA